MSRMVGLITCCWCRDELVEIGRKPGLTALPAGINMSVIRYVLCSTTALSAALLVAAVQPELAHRHTCCGLFL